MYIQKQEHPSITKIKNEHLCHQSWLRKERPRLGNSDKAERMQRFIDALGGLNAVYNMAHRTLFIKYNGGKSLPSKQGIMHNHIIESNIERINAFANSDIPNAIFASATAKLTLYHGTQMMEFLKEIFDECEEGLLKYMVEECIHNKTHHDLVYEADLISAS